jgi:hypothetical protein
MVRNIRVTSRDGVNAARYFFEHHGCTFQEIDQQQDIGKDAYVDLADHQGITPLCVALQIKAGTSYRNVKGEYAIPVDNHADLWRRSTVPVFGIVHDPEDKQLRWVDLTGYLRAHPEHCGGSIPVARQHTLDAAILHGTLTDAARAYSAQGATRLVLDLVAPDPIQTVAVYDAWALSRSDPRFLLVLRRFILDLQPESLRHAIWLLSHIGLHPDILWTEDNWIKPEAKELLRPSLRWSPEELARMLGSIDYEDYGRGTIGQCLDVLLYEDPNIVRKLHLAIPFLLGDSDIVSAVRAASLALTHSPSQRKELRKLVKAFPELLEDEGFREISATVNEFGNLSLY